MLARRHFVKRAAAATGVVFCGCGLRSAAHAQEPATRRLPVTLNGKRIRTIEIGVCPHFPRSLSPPRLVGLRLVLGAGLQPNLGCRAAREANAAWVRISARHGTANAAGPRVNLHRTEPTPAPQAVVQFRHALGCAQRYVSTMVAHVQPETVGIADSAHGGCLGCRARSGNHEGQSRNGEATGENAVVRTPSGARRITDRNITGRGHGNLHLLCVVAVRRADRSTLHCFTPRAASCYHADCGCASADRARSAAPRQMTPCAGLSKASTRRAILSCSSARSDGQEFSGKTVRCSRADIL
jgi:hypothetical protein